MALTSGKRPLFETLYTKVPVISGLGATRTLSIDESSATILLDRAAGIVVTLPLAVPGLVYTFKTTVSVTSNNYKVITGAATEFFVGSIQNVKTDLTTLQSIPNGTSHIAVTMNGTTTGGLIGTSYTFTCLSATRWEVDGVNMGSGVIATPLAAS